MRSHDDVVRKVACEFEERTHEHLRAMCAAGNSKVTLKLLASLKIELRPIDAEDSASVPPVLIPEAIIEGLGHEVQEIADQLGRQFLSSRAKRGRRDRIGSGEVNPVSDCLIPECIEHVAIAPTIPIGNHVKKQSK
jgi:hypothetical protein